LPLRHIQYPHKESNIPLALLETPKGTNLFLNFSCQNPHPQLNSTLSPSSPHLLLKFSPVCYQPPTHLNLPTASPHFLYCSHYALPLTATNNDLLSPPSLIDYPSSFFFVRWCRRPASNNLTSFASPFLFESDKRNEKKKKSKSVCYGVTYCYEVLIVTQIHSTNSTSVLSLAYIPHKGCKNALPLWLSLQTLRYLYRSYDIFSMALAVGRSSKHSSRNANSAFYPETFRY
jgi:hypothetical protein